MGYAAEMGGYFSRDAGVILVFAVSLGMWINHGAA